METTTHLSAQAAFMLLTAVYITLLLRELRKGIALSSLTGLEKKTWIKRIIVVILGWAAFVTAWSVSGAMANFSLFPFNLLPILLIPMILLVVLMSSKGLDAALQHIPPANLVRLQSFRFFVEILLWMLFTANLLPVQMTFEGRNFDILAGISAPIIALLMVKGKIPKVGIIIWNVASLGLLLNIVIIAILSTPSPWRVFTNEPANYIVTHFPISWLPGFLVPLAYYLHFLSIRQLTRRKAPLTFREEQIVSHP